MKLRPEFNHLQLGKRHECSSSHQGSMQEKSAILLTWESANKIAYDAFVIWCWLKP
jgi:hypothetical protein